MYQQYFAGMAWQWLPLLALFLFLTMFVLMLVRTFVVKRKTDFDAVAALPLSDGDVTHSSEVKP